MTSGMCEAHLGRGVLSPAGLHAQLVRYDPAVEGALGPVALEVWVGVHIHVEQRLPGHGVRAGPLAAGARPSEGLHGGGCTARRCSGLTQRCT